jgi:hypothetical protein
MGRDPSSKSVNKSPERPRFSFRELSPYSKRKTLTNIGAGGANSPRRPSSPNSKTPNRP